MFLSTLPFKCTTQIATLRISCSFVAFRREVKAALGEGEFQEKGIQYRKHDNNNNKQTTATKQVKEIRLCLLIFLKVKTHLETYRR